MKKSLFLIFTFLLILTLSCNQTAPKEEGSTGIGADVSFSSSILLLRGYASAGSILYSGPGDVGDSVENNTKVPMPRAGTMKNFKIYVHLGTHNQPATIRIRKNGTDSGISVTVPAGLTGTFSSAQTASFAEGDLLSIQFDNSASSSGTIYTNFSMVYE